MLPLKRKGMDMTIHMLEYFIAVAECQSFTDAAGRCFVSQSALSRAMANLEKEVGCALIDRENRKSVTLTPAGDTMLVEARRVLGQLDAMVERVRQIDGQTRSVVTIGYIAYGLLQTFRTAAQAALAQAVEEGIRIEPVYGSAREIKERLLSSELDCAILPETVAMGMRDCRYTAVCQTDMRVLIPKENPLFGCTSVRLEQLADMPFVLFDAKDLPEIYARNIAQCMKAGFMPRVVGTGKKMGDVAALLHQHQAVGLASEAFVYAQNEDLQLVPIEGLAYSNPLTLTMRSRAVNPQAKHLFELVSQKYEKK